MDNVAGRTDDLHVVRGVNVDASQIEDVVVGLDDVSGHYRIDVHRDGALDTLRLTAERLEGAERSNEEIEALVDERSWDALDPTPDEVRVVDPGTIERTEVGKVKRVFDHR